MVSAISGRNRFGSVRFGSNKNRFKPVRFQTVLVPKRFGSNRFRKNVFFLDRCLEKLIFVGRFLKTVFSMGQSSREKAIPKHRPANNPANKKAQPKSQAKSYKKSIQISKQQRSALKRSTPFLVLFSEI